jgi:hypothetical protein
MTRPLTSNSSYNGIRGKYKLIGNRIVTSLYYYSDLSIITMVQQVDMPSKELHRFNKSRYPEVTRSTEHYYGGKTVHKMLYFLNVQKLELTQEF